MDVTQPEWLEQVKGVLENLNQGVIINDSSNRIVFANPIFLQMIGLAADQLLGRVVTDLFPPEDIQPLLKHIERRQVEGQGLYEFYLPQTGGRRLPVLVTSRQIKHIDGQVFAVVTATDISAQKRAEAELRQANERLEKRHREMEAELLLAARVQQSLAPSSLSWGRVSVETFYEPARTIGGDFGLVAPSADSIFVMVSDISGHGISSALIANRIYTETMSLIERGEGLGPMLRHLNQFAKRDLSSAVFYFTLVAARLDREARILEFAGAGHPPALVVRPGHPPRLLESQSAVLGLLDNAVHCEATIKIPLEAGDRVVIYTDGFTESFNARREMLGMEGFSEILCQTAALSLPDMKHEIVNRVAAWRAGPAADDMSLVLLEINK